jgi:hypothetical protein
MTQGAVCVSTTGQSVPLSMCPACQPVQTECALPACPAPTPTPTAPPPPPPPTQPSPFVSLSAFLGDAARAGSQQPWASRAGGFNLTVVPTAAAAGDAAALPVVHAASVAVRPGFPADAVYSAARFGEELRTVLSQALVQVAPQRAYRLMARVKVLQQRPGNVRARACVRACACV